MYLSLNNVGVNAGAHLSIRCPHCGLQGTFNPINQVHDLFVSSMGLGQRCCPNPHCYGNLFVIYEQGTLKVVRSFPTLRLDFDSANIPDAIANSLKQAVTCHAEECYVAAAIMIRRCLEELCEDKKAIGDTLKARLLALRTSVILPPELFAAMDELRLLGNDAAHVEAKTYDDIGKDEIETAIAVSKEILKSVYQLGDLLKRLQALKRP